MAKSRFEIDLTRNSLRRLESIQRKLRDSAAKFEDIDVFIAGQLDRQADGLDEIISEIRLRKAF